MKKLVIKSNQDFVPVDRKLVTQQYGKIIKTEDVNISSKEELDALLRKVKQFNLDPGNKENGIIQIIS